MKKRIFRIFIVPPLKLLAKLLYKKEHLTGRHFDNSQKGWVWVLKGIWFQKILGFNRKLPFPASPSITVSNPENLILGKNNLNNLQSFGIYYQNASAKIYLGDDCYIGPNVGLITANHDIDDLSKSLEGQDIHIGNNCWIGMNSTVLPGVTLGDKTVVGAGSVVTKSFPSGNIVIAGNPAKVIKNLNEK